MKEITTQQMLEAGVHFGHRTSSWHPNMKPYIFCVREGVHIIDLEKTQEKLIQALKFVAGITKEGGTILFVGTKRQAKDIVKKAAESCGMPYITERWLGGTFTNFKTIHKLIQKLHDLEEKEKAGELKKYTKKEQLLKYEEIEKLNREVGGIKQQDKLPEAVFIVDIVQENLALKEARKVGVPVVALCDTNADPKLVDWPVPSNDDAVKVIEMMCDAVAETIKENYKKPAVKKIEN